MFKRIIQSESGEVFLGMMLGIVEVVAVATISLGAIIMQSGSNTISQAHYASFVQQFGEYRDQVKIDAATIMAETGMKGKTINNAQKFHMVANGFKDFNENDNNDIYNMNIPVGYVIPDVIKDALYISKDNNDIVAYLITDQIINGYEFREDLKFYADEKTEEYHLVTSDGTVFTIPGYPEKQEDGTIKYYVTSQGNYYVVGENLKNPISEKNFTKLYGKDKNNNVITTSNIYNTKLRKKIEIMKDSKSEVFITNESKNFKYIFGEFSDQVKIDAAVIMAKTGKKGKNINNAQKFHMAANGFQDYTVDDNRGIYNMQLPVGYVIPEVIQDALGLNEYNINTNNIVAYLITDQVIDDYQDNQDFKVYADKTEEEYHLVTSLGEVFTIPGFPEKQKDGTTRYYINSYGAYYTVEKGSKKIITREDFTRLYGIDKEGNVLNESPIYDKKLKKKVNILNILSEEEKVFPKW